MKKVGFTIFVLCLVSQPGLTRGQQDSWENLNSLRAGENVEVVDLQSVSTRGTFLSFSEDKIVLRVDGAETPISRANVQRVISGQPRRLRNAALGAAIGVGVGLAIAIPVWIGEGATAYPGISGPIVGGGAGAGIGAAVPLGSQTVYRVKKPSNAP
jgi:hypothetical protein